MSFAKTGKRACAPPKITANMSRVIAPSSTWRFRTNATPSLIAARLTARRGPSMGRSRRKKRLASDPPISIMWARYAASTPLTAMSTPPMNGPVTNPSDWMVELTTMAFGNASFVTTCGRSAWRAGFSKALPSAVSRTSP
mgnify:CR=1 FL=1